MSFMKKYPFKFLDSYQKEDSKWFFGRDEEIEALYEMIFQSTVVLVYGASGTGKTSLINCGLAGKFQPHDWFPIMVRRGNDLNASLEKKLLDSGGTFESQSFDFAWEDEESEANTSSTSKLSPVGNALHSIYQKSFRPIYLIFDQFEELFVLGSKKEQQQFFETTLNILKSNQPVKIVFSIREEYLGYLYEFEKVVPQLLKKKLRVEPMNLAKVKQVIIGAGTSDASNISIKKGNEDAVSEGVFEKIKGQDKSLTIQLPFLQVFLDKYYLTITNDKSRVASAEFSEENLSQMGEIGDILVELLEEQVGLISTQLKPDFPKVKKSLIWSILSPFSTLEGTKEPISKEVLKNRLPEVDPHITDAVIEAFINSRILRYIESSDLYEIAHDALAKPIAERRTAEETTLLEIKRLIKSQVSINEEAREHFSEKQLAFIDPFVKKINLNKEETEWIAKSKTHLQNLKEAEIRAQVEAINAKKRSRRKWQRIIGVIVLLALIGTSIFAIKLKQNVIKIEETKQGLEAYKEKSQSILRLMMIGRDTIYERVSDSILDEILYSEITLPIDSLLEPKAHVTLSNKGSYNRNFVLWVEVPSFRKYEIQEVQYNLCEGFIDIQRTSTEPSNSFSIGYLGYGYCDEVMVDIILKSGDTIHKVYSFKTYFEEHPSVQFKSMK